MEKSRNPVAFICTHCKIFNVLKYFTSFDLHKNSLKQACQRVILISEGKRASKR